MIKISSTAKSLVFTICGLCLLSLVISYIAIVMLPVFKGVSPIVFAKGLLFGSVFSCLRVILMEHAVNRSVDKGKNAATYATLHYGIRFFLTAVVLFVSAMEPSIDLYGTIIGLLLLRVAVSIVGFREGKSTVEV